MPLERLRASLAGAPVVLFGDYPYFIHPITDGLPLGDPAVLRVVIVDDVLSTGGTLRAVTAVLRKIGATIVDVVIVFEKTEKKAEMERELGVTIKTLMRVAVRDGKMVEVT